MIYFWGIMRDNWKPLAKETQNGRFITVELSPRFVSKQQRRSTNDDSLSELFEH
jgi:hypothetical protein